MGGEPRSPLRGFLNAVTSVPTAVSKMAVALMSATNELGEWKVMIRRLGFGVIAPTALALFLGEQATATELNREPLILLASNVSNAAIEPMVPVCARMANVEIQARYANNPAVVKEIDGGARFDVVVLETHMLADLATKRLVARESIQPLAALRMGIATRQAGPTLQNATVAAFKRTLLSATSIGYAGDGHSGAVFLGVLDRLHLRDPLANRLVPFTGGYPGAVQASERTQFIVAPFFKPLPSPLRLIGYLPRSLNADVDISAGAANARPDAAAFLACLRLPSSRSVFASKGYRVGQ